MRYLDYAKWVPHTMV
jgi:hypothetical protein